MVTMSLGGGLGPINWFISATFYWSASCPVIMCYGIDFSSFLRFFYWILDFHFIAYNCTVQDDTTPNGMLLDLGGICKERKKKDTTNHLILLKGCGV